MGLFVERISCHFGESRNGLSSRAGGRRRSVTHLGTLCPPGPSSLVLLGVGGRSLPKPFSNLVVLALSPQDGSLQCPTCKTIYGVKTGTQPPGKMEYHLIPHSLPGHPDCKTIRIIYSIPPGVQVSPPSAIGCHCLGFKCLQVNVSFSPLKMLKPNATDWWLLNNRGLFLEAGKPQTEVLAGSVSGESPPPSS